MRMGDILKYAQCATYSRLDKKGSVADRHLTLSREKGCNIDNIADTPDGFFVGTRCEEVKDDSKGKP